MDRESSLIQFRETDTWPRLLGPCTKGTWEAILARAQNPGCLLRWAFVLQSPVLVKLRGKEVISLGPVVSKWSLHCHPLQCRGRAGRHLGKMNTKTSCLHPTCVFLKVREASPPADLSNTCGQAELLLLRAVPRTPGPFPASTMALH